MLEGLRIANAHNCFCVQVARLTVIMNCSKVSSSWYCVIIQVSVVLKRTVVYSD